MPKLPNPIDPTLAAADQAMLAANESRKPRSLGASWLGHDCDRHVWLKFRHAAQEQFQPLTLKRFEDGHRTEELVIQRIKAVEGIEWHDINPETNWQYGFTDFGGHFKGFYDGIVLGLLQAPKAWHIGEVKAAEKWDGLDKAKAKVGEKNALLEWNKGYYIQAQLYMHYESVDRHYMVAASPGGRFWTSARTEADPVEAMRQRGRAERIIFSDEAPPRISDSPSYYLCRSFCFMADICHGTALPERACRNCIHATPLRTGTKGDWTCAVAEFGAVCPKHRFLPSMINGQQVDVRGDDIVYEMKDGVEYVDQGPQQRGPITAP